MPSVTNLHLIWPLTVEVDVFRGNDLQVVLVRSWSLHDSVVLIQGVHATGVGFPQRHFVDDVARVHVDHPLVSLDEHLHDEGVAGDVKLSRELLKVQVPTDSASLLPRYFLFDPRLILLREKHGRLHAQSECRELALQQLVLSCRPSARIEHLLHEVSVQVEAEGSRLIERVHGQD